MLKNPTYLWVSERFARTMIYWKGIEELTWPYNRVIEVNAASKKMKHFYVLAS